MMIFQKISAIFRGVFWYRIPGTGIINFAETERISEAPWARLGARSASFSVLKIQKRRVCERATKIQ
jgi:hypothetical protein